VAVQAASADFEEVDAALTIGVRPNGGREATPSFSCSADRRERPPAAIGERQPDEAQRHHRPGRGFGDGGGLADARLQLADVDEAFHAQDAEVDGDGVDNDSWPKPPSTSLICCLRVTVTPKSSKIKDAGDWGEFEI
jgi:hypothetical protein